MSEHQEDDPLLIDAPATVGRIREVLDRAGYSELGIAKALGAEGSPSLSVQPAHLPRLLRKAAGREPLNVLIRLFMLGGAVDLETLRDAVRPTTPDEWVELGLLQLGPAGAAALVALLPQRELLLACDAPWLMKARSSQFVLGNSKSTLALAQLTIRRPARRTLDLGAGNGIQAFFAAAHSQSVLGIDRNARAVCMARFNAQLNGLKQVEFLEGNLLEPVRGERFDLVVANLPFVISPESLFLFRDGGLGSDRICETVVREAPPLLEDGGFAQILCNWAHVVGQDWRERLAGWVAGSGCDVWIMRLNVMDTASYTTDWIEAEAVHDLGQAREKFERWMAYYERERIEAVGYGLITLRRSPARSNWFRCDDAPIVRGPCGDAVFRGFELRNFLETVRQDDALLRTRFRLNPEIRWEQTLRPSAESWTVSEAKLRQAGGLAYAGSIDPPTYELINRCRGQAKLSEILAQVAAIVERDLPSILPTSLAVVRSLVEQGFLLPVGES